MSAADVVKSHMAAIDAHLDPLTAAETERFSAIMGACGTPYEIALGLDN